MGKEGKAGSFHLENGVRTYPFERVEGDLRVLDSLGLSLAMSWWILEAFVRRNDLLHV